MEIGRQAGMLERPIEAAPRLAGGDREKMAAGMQFSDQLAGALEQRDFRVLAEEVATIVPRQFRMRRFRQFREQHLQRLAQAEADDMAGFFARWHRQVHIETGRLYAGGDHTGGVHQGAIPIKDQEIKTTRDCLHDAGPIWVETCERRAARGRSGIGLRRITLRQPD